MAPEADAQTHQEMILAFLADGGDEYTSGEVLSDKLGLSRTAVWKYVEALRHKGYRIDAIPARGYRLVEIPDRVSALEVGPLLSTHDLGRTISYFEVLESTNATAYRMASEGAFHGEVVIAEQQTAGKGRRGRTWISPAGQNLYFSAILRPELPPQRAPELTLVAAVALAEILRESGAREAAIKWPNDVLIGGRKVAGILTELSADTERVHFVIVGVGVNLNGRAEDFPEELRPLATSLAAEREAPVPRALFTAALLTRLEHWLDVHAEEGFDAIREAWKKLSVTLGQEVLVRTDRNEFRGMAEDIDDSGALLVKRSDGVTERVLAGDVEQLRPRSTKKD